MIDNLTMVAANQTFLQNMHPMLHIPALGLHIPLQPWMSGPVQWIFGQINNGNMMVLLLLIGIVVIAALIGYMLMKEAGS